MSNLQLTLAFMERHPYQTWFLLFTFLIGFALVLGAARGK